MKITSADFVPELVFQPVKITSADSAGQCNKKLYKELNQELYTGIGSYLRWSYK